MTTNAYTLQSLAVYLGWALPSTMTDREVWQFAVAREQMLRLAQDLLETSRSDAHTAEDAIRERVATLRAELDVLKAREAKLRAALEAMPCERFGYEDCRATHQARIETVRKRGMCRRCAALAEGEDQ